MSERQEVKQAQQEDRSQYPQLSSHNHNRLETIVLFDLIIAQDFSPDEITSVEITSVEITSVEITSVEFSLDFTDDH